MANIQKTLDALQPYVIGIRYLDGLPLIDAVFKDGWTVPDSDVIKRIKGNEDLNYYMIFSEQEGIGLDELLEYVDVTIKANIEREKKHELLKEKVNELKELFKKTSLIKLKRLDFCFKDEDLMPELNEFNLDDSVIEPAKNEYISPGVPLIEHDNIQVELIPEPESEDAEIEAEEKRAENFRKIQETNKLNGQLNNVKTKVELPPRKSYANDVDVMDEECDCGPDEACNKCIMNKDL